MALAIRNLDAALGAEVSRHRSCRRPVARGRRRGDREALGASGLSWCFMARSLTDPQLIAFSKNFGELDPPGPNPYGEPFHKEHPELNVISNVVEDGKPIGNLGDGEAVWHADMTYVDVPPKAAMLHALEVPPPAAGGNTYFANMFAAYEALPADLKKAAEGKVAVHDASTQQRRHAAQGLQGGHRRARDGRCASSARAHDPTTGRKALFLGRRPNAYVLGLELRRERGAARCAVGARDAAALCHVPRMEGRRRPDVE